MNYDIKQHVQYTINALEILTSLQIFVTYTIVKGPSDELNASKYNATHTVLPYPAPECYAILERKDNGINVTPASIHPPMMNLLVAYNRFILKYTPTAINNSNIFKNKITLSDSELF